ncbi:MAG: agmatinase [Gemmatimonadetes bacterium]|nr:MAG: agmatinase [Gemmatimonadota bacterium]
MSKSQKLAQFDPNGLGATNGNLFGFPFTPEEAEVVILPVPWEVTVSYHSGTAQGPAAILAASPQLDLIDPDKARPWEIGVAMLEISEIWQKRNQILRKRAETYIHFLETTQAGHLRKSEQLKDVWAMRDEVNTACNELHQWVQDEATKWLKRGKTVGILGGDHSTPLGLMHALAERYPRFSILQIDAHADLRDSYEGFKFSHASIMYNALKIPQIQRLVQVGIRDICPEEVNRIETSNGRICTFYDWDLKRKQFTGQTWHDQCERIISPLSEAVYISLDIDGLDPKLCPHTGTPVPGGLQFEELVYLLTRLVESGRNIIGFDLCEVAPGDGDWDANVGARVLYRLINRTNFC